MSGVSPRRQALVMELLHATDGPCRIKLCGMFREQDIVAVNAAEPDFCGFIVDFPESHRSLSSTGAARLAHDVRPDVFTVGVSVDAPVARVGDNGSLFDVLQLHGHEDNGYIRHLRLRTRAPIIQAIQVLSEKDVERANRSAADMILLDSGHGTGNGFDWSLINGMSRPFVLAGGLTPENVAQAVGELHPWGVDMSSGIETARLKDPEKIRAAVAAVRSASNA